MNGWVTLFLGLTVFSLQCQVMDGLPNSQTDSLPADSAQVLPLQAFMDIVLDNHPVVKQANLVTDGATAMIREARGNFDPKVEIDYQTKNFKDKEYYDLFNATLKVPTWFPIDPKISVDRNEGVFLNPQNSIPEEDGFEQVNLGVSLPVGQGLFMDLRRLALRQAEAYQGIAEAERIKLLNKILISAFKDYWNWYLSYREYLLLARSIDIADELFRRILIDYNYGEAAMVDTIQAKITLQTRQADFEKVKFNLENARLQLATYLWTAEGVPLELRRTTTPDTLASFAFIPSSDQLAQLIQWATANHPDILKLEGKQQQLEFEQRWNREMFKPQVDLSYSFINTPLTPGGEFVSPDPSENYKFGLDFSFPLLLRKARGKLQKTQVKILDNTYAINRATLNIQNQILSKYAEIETSGNLAIQYESIAANYNRLLQAELLNVSTGESDLFKLNIQQDKYITSQIKYLENLVKFQKNKMEILFESGVPFLDINQINP